jgi:hypothetical protein
LTKNRNSIAEKEMELERAIAKAQYIMAKTFGFNPMENVTGNTVASGKRFMGLFGDYNMQKDIISNSLYPCKQDAPKLYGRGAAALYNQSGYRGDFDLPTCVLNTDSAIYKLLPPADNRDWDYINRKTLNGRVSLGTAEIVGVGTTGTTVDSTFCDVNFPCGKYVYADTSRSFISPHCPTIIENDGKPQSSSLKPCLIPESILWKNRSVYKDI